VLGTGYFIQINLFFPHILHFIYSLVCDLLVLCAGLQQKNMDEIEIILARKYKLAYCPIPKTGCSNMKRLMLALNGFGNKSDEVFPVLSLCECYSLSTLG